MQIGNYEFDIKNKTYIMGILNITPDSFSDGGRWNQLDAALRHVETMIEEGADLIDIGGESTRPGHTFVDAEEEIKRIVPIIRAVRKQFDIPISIDTYKSDVADAALNEGADLVNDIWGFKHDKHMASVVARHGATCCLMHNKTEPVYDDFLADVLKETAECIGLAKSAGVADEKIIIDPGVGFGKTYEMNLEVINRLERFHELSYPILLGTSRKSVIGTALDLPVDQRAEGTVATSVIGVMKGCGFIRVHDVKENKRAVMMTEAVLGKDKKHDI